MNALLEMKLHKAGLKADLKGRKVEPSVGLDDKGFKYVPAIKTDLRQTFARARAELGVLKTV